ncbi:J domain-containing protein [Hydrogenimonas sp.]
MSRAYRIIHEALEVLGLPAHVNLKEINERYRYLAAGKHPDAGGEQEEMARINEAYEILKKYIENYRFSFSEEEIGRQFPEEAHASRFRF